MFCGDTIAYLSQGNDPQLSSTCARIFLVMDLIEKLYYENI
jgi:hypothetical protein